MKVKYDHYGDPVVSVRLDYTLGPYFVRLAVASVQNNTGRWPSRREAEAELRDVLYCFGTFADTHVLRIDERTWCESLEVAATLFPDVFQLSHEAA